MQQWKSYQGRIVHAAFPLSSLLWALSSLCVLSSFAFLRISLYDVTGVADAVVRKFDFEVLSGILGALEKNGENKWQKKHVTCVA